MKASIHCVDGTVIEGANVSDALRGLDFKRSLEPVQCACGKPALYFGLCRGCDEDKFYGRDVQGGHIGIE